MKQGKTIALLIALQLLAGIFFSAGCSSENTFDKNKEGPQIILNPGAIPLSVAALAKTKFVFKGKGFNPGDSVLIEMLEVPGEEGNKNIPIANAQVDEEGKFEAEIGLITKLSEFMRAKIDAIKNIIILTREPIPEGVYKIRATSLMSDTPAPGTLLVESPCLIDCIKDRLGIMMGKIVTEDPGEEKYSQD